MSQGSFIIYLLGGTEDRKAGTEKSRRVLGRAKKNFDRFQGGQKIFNFFFIFFFLQTQGIPMGGNASSMQLHLKCIANLIQIYSQCYISLLTVIFCTFFEGGQKKIASHFRAGKKKIFFRLYFSSDVSNELRAP